jgi:hypothetical protein
MRKKMTVETYSGFFQKYNVFIGIIVCVLLTSISLTILPFRLLFLGDIYIVLGCFFGLYITFKYKKESQSHIKTGLIVGLIGSVLSLILSSILLALVYGADIVISFVFIFWESGIIFVFIGLILGYVFGYYYRKKDLEQTKYPLY